MIGLIKKMLKETPGREMRPVIQYAEEYLDPFSLSYRYSKNYHHKPLYTVPHYKLRNILGMAFHPLGGHYFTLALSSIEKKSSWQGANKSLSEYYRLATPSTYGELFLMGSDGHFSSAKIGGDFYLPWFQDPVATRAKRGWQYFGPASSSFVDNQWSRLYNVFNKIKHEGYNPPRCPSYDRYPQGFFLVDSNDFVFVVTNATHRVAAVSSCNAGNGKIQVTLRDNTLPVISSKEIDSWPLVRLGQCSHDEAHYIFKTFFIGNCYAEKFFRGVVP